MCISNWFFEDLGPKEGIEGSQIEGEIELYPQILTNSGCLLTLCFHTILV